MLSTCMCECVYTSYHIPPTVGSNPASVSRPKPATHHHPVTPRRRVGTQERGHPDRPYWLSPSKVSLAQGGVWGTG